ncbi:MAG: hypothetical protein AABX51_00875 [Nanoarchaeota archaeon]
MKRGAANYGADFAFGVAIFFMLIILLFAFTSCAKGKKEDSVKTPITGLKSQEELLVLIKTPVKYNNEEMSFSDLVVKYYYLEEGGLNDNAKGKMKEFIENFVEEFAFSAKGVSPGDADLCWNFQIFKGDDDIMRLEGDCDWSLATSKYKDCLREWPETIIPLEPFSKHPSIKVTYRNPGLDTSKKLIVSSLDPDRCG